MKRPTNIRGKLPTQGAGGVVYRLSADLDEDLSADIMGSDGRQLPTYKPKRPRPRREAPLPGWLSALIGIVPGLRLSLMYSARAGLPLLAAGGLLVIGIIVVGVSLLGAPARLAALGIAPRFTVFPAAALLGLITLFELLRVAGALSEPVTGSRWARALAGCFLPALGASLACFFFGGLAPRWLEPVWVASTALSVGALPAAVYAALGFTESRRYHRRVSAALLLVVLIAGGLAIWVGSEGLTAHLRAQSFTVVPALLGR